MSDLAEFLRARLDEDEAAAKAASGGQWDVCGPPELCHIEDASEQIVLSARGGLDSTAPVDHAVRHDPARVLREVEAKRKILGNHTPAVSIDMVICDWCSEPSETGHPEDRIFGRVRWPCPDVRALAAIWSDHPDYDPAWA